MHNSTRRQFIGNTGKAAIAGTAIFAPSLNTKKPQMQNVFIHHVFFWLNNPDSKADRDKLVEGLNKFSKVRLLKNIILANPPIRTGKSLKGPMRFPGVTTLPMRQTRKVIKQIRST